MCWDFKNTKRKNVTGYKVVAVNEKNGKYYSVMTGNEYPVNEDMPIWTTQKEEITLYFMCNILDMKYVDPEEYAEERHPAWNDEMVGKTTVFIQKAQALKFRDNLIVYKHLNKREYRIVVVKARLKKGLKVALYQLSEVYIGKRIEIISEVE